MRTILQRRDTMNLHPHMSRRRFLASAAAVAGGAFLPAMTRAAETSPELKAAEPWAPHAKAAPLTAKRGEAFVVDANGTRTCSGGWQWRFDGVQAGQTYEVTTEVSHEGLSVPRDALLCLAIWGAPKPNEDPVNAIWEYLLPKPAGEGRVRFSRRLAAPENASQLTIRATLRWTAAGKTLWQAPCVASANSPLVKRPAVRVCVVTGEYAHRRGRQFKSVRDNIEFYGPLCEAACRQCRPQLIVLPEIALQWGVPGSPLDLAVPAPGPETEAFAAIARQHRVRIALGLLERDGDAVYNSALLIGPTGFLDGRYHKVHLAAGGEDVSGILPGDGFPVFDTELGRIGCNICMDSSAVESSRMVGLNGADFLLLPIMGDHRADRWNRGTPIHNDDRWRAIMRTRAMDNQLCMVVARNNTQASCIVDRKGEVLAWNDGDEPFITADVTLDDGYRIWQGGCFRDVNWLQRRPHLYGAFTDPASHGGSR
jgi:predicted amidohydrolase